MVAAKTMRLWAVALLLVIIAAMIYLGCGCGGFGGMRETFADAVAETEKVDNKPEKVVAPKAEAEVVPETDADTDAEVAPEVVAPGEMSAATKKAADELGAAITERALKEAKKSADVKKKDAVNGEMNKKEQELFEDLKNNKLSDKDITNLVKTGILNEALVEKFLAKLDATAADLKLEDAQMRDDAKMGAEGRTLAGDTAASAALATNIEGFCSMAPGYARWA